MSVERAGSAPVDPVAGRILDAALQTMITVGLKRTTVEAIAARAGVSHMSVYRRWSTKNHVLLAVLLREVEVLFADIDADIAGIRDMTGKAITGFSTLYWFLHTHPLVGAAIRSDPETMLPLVTTSVGPAIDRAAGYISDSIRRDAGRTGVSVTDPDALGEVFARLIHSLLISPTATTAVNTRTKVAAYARLYVVPLLAVTPRGVGRAANDFVE